MSEQRGSPGVRTLQTWMAPESDKPDFICFGKIIVELKAAKEIAPEHKAQLINYLKATQMKLGLLVNFGSYPKAEIERMVL